MFFFFSLFCYEDVVDSSSNKLLPDSLKDKEPLKESNESSTVSTEDVVVRSAIDPKELVSDADPLETDPISSAVVGEGPLELENSVDDKSNDTSAINTCSSNTVDDDLFGEDMMVDDIDQHGNQNMENVDDESSIKNINNGNHSSGISNTSDDIHNGGCTENTTSVEQDTESIKDVSIGDNVDTNNDDDGDGEIRKDSNRKESGESNTSLFIVNASSSLETLSEEDKILLEIDSLNMKREDLL